MSILTNDRRFEEAVNDIESIGKGAEPKNMCDVLDRVEKRGEDRGIKIGESRGKLEGAKESALRMKKDGLSIEKISIYVNIDEETIKKWINENNSLVEDTDKEDKTTEKNEIDGIENKKTENEKN